MIGRLPALLLTALLAGPAAAQARITQAEALLIAFPPPAAVERRTAFLSPAQLAAARTSAGREVEVATSVVTYYVGRVEGTPVGVAYFDAHRVRTLSEVLMIVVDTVGRIQRVEVLAFQEPPSYRAPEGWLDQLDGRALDASLSLRGGVVGITGATLTAQAVVRASRRALAIHGVIRPFAASGSAAP